MKSSCRDRDTWFFYSRDAGCFEIDGRIGSDRGLQKSFDDQKNAE